MKDLGKIMQQAQQMQAKMQEAQEKIESTEAEGVAGAGLASVRHVARLQATVLGATQ